MWYNRDLLLICFGCHSVISQFLECHDDILYEPQDGIMNDIQFTWLGLLQYIHVRKGNPHYFRVPRVVLISRQFVISTAVDAAQVPEGYALGNVVFGEYERDERECGIASSEMMKAGVCNPAVMIVPLLDRSVRALRNVTICNKQPMRKDKEDLPSGLPSHPNLLVVTLLNNELGSDVLLHPEYKYFGRPNSIALLKLIKPVRSAYMLPVCLPTSDYKMRVERPMSSPLWHIDFASDAPREFYGEEKEVTQVFMLPMELCFFNQSTGDNNSSSAVKREMCTTDCNFHSGAPTITHEHTGHWTLVSIAEGGAPCPDPYKPRIQPPPPPRHILLQPYVTWITNAVSGKENQRHVKNEEHDPFGYLIAREGMADGSTPLNPRGWVGRWWLAGIRCFDRGDAAKENYRFYHESFIVHTSKTMDFTYFLQIDSISASKIACLKVGTPYPLGQPRCWNLMTPTVYLRIPVRGVLVQLRFFVEAWAVPVEDEYVKKLMKDRNMTSNSKSSDSKISTSEEEWP